MAIPASWVRPKHHALRFGANTYERTVHAAMIRRFKSADLLELTTFGLVGLTAMAVHYSAAIGAIELLGMAIWLANIVGFLMAVPVS